MSPLTPPLPVLRSDVPGVSSQSHALFPPFSTAKERQAECHSCSILKIRPPRWAVRQRVPMRCYWVCLCVHVWVPGLRFGLTPGSRLRHDWCVQFKPTACAFKPANLHTLSINVNDNEGLRQRIELFRFGLGWLLVYRGENIIITYYTYTFKP